MEATVIGSIQNGCSVADAYARALADGATPDPAQAAAVAALDRVRDALIASAQPRSLLDRLSDRLLRSGRRRPVRGLYLHGGVGRGKTWLMDLFFEGLPFRERRRSHFHRFMQRVHAELKAMSDIEDPLARVADTIAADTRVLCFDEFHVSDIGDAMILGRLMSALFERGVCLVATSNLPPDRLYHDGLQRARFLPAIAAIQRHTEVLAVDGGEDYRLRTLTQAEIYHVPSDALAMETLDAVFDAIAPERGERRVRLDILGREVPTLRLADGVVWFDFEAVCGGPRSAADYIELARCFSTVMITGVPSLDREHEDEARRFITLVDEFYDRNVNLILAAAVPLEALYRGRRLSFEFERTASRLLEMRSHEYLAREHLP